MPPKRKATNQLVSKKGTAKRSKSSAPKSRDTKQPSKAPPVIHKWYKIRDIVDENSTKYKVDWEDDPKTGEKFPPEWRPKNEVTRLAIVAWEKRKHQAISKKAKARKPPSGPTTPIHSRARSDSPLFVSSRSPSQESRQTRVRRRVTVESSPPSPEPPKVLSLTVRDTPQPIHAIDTSRQLLPYSVTQSSSGSTPEVINATTESSPRMTQPPKLNQPNLAVRVSPHHIPSSQVWEYLSYSSVPYSIIRDKGVESSPNLETHDFAQTGRDYIVPDSQSLNHITTYPLSNGPGTNGADSHSDIVHTVSASSIISGITRTANPERPVSGTEHFESPWSPERPSRSLPILSGPGRPQTSQNTHLSGAKPEKRGTRSLDAPYPISQTRSDPHELPSPDQALSRGSQPLSGSSHANQTTTDLDLWPQNLPNTANGHRESGQRRKQDQALEAFDSQKSYIHTLPQQSKLSRSLSPKISSNQVIQIRNLSPSTSSQILTPETKGKPLSSNFKIQTHPDLNSSSNFPRRAAPPLQNGGLYASSFRSQDLNAIAFDTSPASNVHSASSQFQTQIPVELDSPLASSRRTNHPSHSRHRSQPTESSTTQARSQPLLNSEEGTRSTKQTPTPADSLVLSQRDPNSQPEKILHSAQDREEICFPSIESAEQDSEKASQITPPSQISWSIDPLSPSRNMAENGQTAISPVVQLPTMNPTPTPERSSVPFRERLRNMRAESAARLVATNINISPSPVQPGNDASKQSLAAVDTETSPPRVTYRSPSTIPKPVPIEPVGDSRLEIQTIEDPISARSSQDLPSVPAPGPKAQPLTQLSQRDIAQALKSPQVGEMEFIVPLPAPARVRDQYVATINSYQKVIHAIVTDEQTDLSTVKKGQEFLDSVESLSVHLDMVDSTTSSQQDVPPDAEALWASNCSFKFQFLQHLIGFTRREDMHIVIVAKEGRLMDLIETFLKGLSASYNRPDAMSSKSGFPGDNLRFSLITSREGESTELLPTANLVIAFDSTFDAANSQVQEVRSHLLNVGQLAPVVHLMIYSSPEHIARCLPSNITGLERLRIMISCVTFTREDFGSLLPEENLPEANAEEVAVFIKAGAGCPWLIPPIRPVEIQGLEFDFQDTQQLTQATTADRQPAKSKRTLDLEDEGRATPKRMRMTPVPDQPDITHISDSAPGTFAASNSQVFQELKVTIEQHQAREKDYKTREEQYKSREEQSKAREAKLQAALSASEARVQELVADLSALQMRYEKRNIQYHTLKHEKRELIARSINLNQAQQKAKLDLEASREKITSLEIDLTISRASLQDSTIPSQAALEAAESSARDAIALSNSAQKKLDSLQSSFEYTRQQYQVASTSAAESANRISELEAANAELEKKASGEMVRLKEANNRAEIEVHKKRIAELEATLEDREDLLKRKEGARGRGVQTRAGSIQPRSPRLGAVSRQGSPMPGFLGVRGRGRFQG